MASTKNRGRVSEVTVNGRRETRTSHRLYTHAVLVLYSFQREIARAEAMGSPEFLRHHRDNFAFHERNAARGDDIAFAAETRRSKEIVAAGFEAFVAAVTAREVEAVYARRQQGRYQWHVDSWSMSEANAVKATKAAKNCPWNASVIMVLAGSVSTLPGDVDPLPACEKCKKPCDTTGSLCATCAAEYFHAKA